MKKVKTALKVMTPEIDERHSAKMSEMRPCLCRNHTPYRMVAEDETREFGAEFCLGCMMCGRKATGDTPRQCMDSWNETCAEKTIN